MLDAIRSLAGADGALLLSCRHDDVAVVLDASPPSTVAGTLRLPYELLQTADGIVLSEALPRRLLSTAYAHWLPSRVTSSALVFDPSPPRDPIGAQPTEHHASASAPNHTVTALLLVWCNGDASGTTVDAATNCPLCGEWPHCCWPPTSPDGTPSARRNGAAAIMRSAPHGIVFVSAHGAEAIVNREAARCAGDSGRHRVGRAVGECDESRTRATRTSSSRRGGVRACCEGAHRGTG